MGTLAAVFLAAVLPLASVEAPPTHAEVMTYGTRLVDAPEDEEDEIIPPAGDPRTMDTEINCPPPTRLRCWMATEDAGVTPVVYCKCSK